MVENIIDLENVQKKVKNIDLPEGSVADTLLKEKENELYGNDKITLEDCIDITKKYLKEEITDNEFNTFGTKMNIRMYLPILEKMQLIMRILATTQISQNVVNPEIITAEMYKNIFYTVILGAYAQVDLGEKDIQTYDNYDLLFPLFEPFIMQYAKKDFEVFRNMMNDSMSLYGLTNISNTMENINMDELKKVARENRELIKNIESKEKLISDLKDIMSMNDPTTKKVVNEISLISIEDINEKLKAEKEKEKEKK